MLAPEIKAVDMPVYEARGLRTLAREHGVSS